MSEIFISHSSHDRELVESHIISLLEACGIGTWYSADEVPGGAEWQKDIRKALDRCDWFLVALSPASVESPWVQSEVGQALDTFEKDRVLPVMIEPCDPFKCDLRLRGRNYINFLGDEEKGREQLLRTLGAEPKEPPQPSVQDDETQRLIETLRAILGQSHEWIVYLGGVR